MSDKVLTDIRAELVRLADQNETLSGHIERISLMLAAMDLTDKLQAATVDLQYQRVVAEIESINRRLRDDNSGSISEGA